MSVDQYPALLVITPLIAAPVCVLVHHARLSWLIATVTSAFCLFIALHLYERVLNEGTIVYSLGGWAAPWGIEYRIDFLNALIAIIVCGAALVMSVFAKCSASKEISDDRLYLFYALWMLNLTGLLGIAITGDAFNLFVFLEISSLSSYALVSLGKSRKALLAAFRYLIMGTIGATFILIGIGLLYMATGSLNMFDVSQRLPDVDGLRTVKVAFAFLVVGIGLKLALFPLHAWLPNAYAYSPSVVSAFLAATATKVAIYMWLRLFYSVFGFEFAYNEMHLATILMLLAIIGIVVCSVIACTQRDVKQLLAYSSVAQTGYMILGISFATTTGLTATIVHLFNHALMKGALFMAIGCVVYRVGSAQLSALCGLGRQMPLTSAAIVIAGLSLIGVPLTAGFISKWYLLQAALGLELWVVAGVIVGSSLLAVVYVWKIVEQMYFRESETPAGEAPWSMLGALWIAVFANVYFGLQTELSVGVANQAASALMSSR